MRYVSVSAALTVILSVAAVTQVASAADMPRKALVAPAPVVNSWTGFYIGANAGWIGSDPSISNAAVGTPDAVLGVVPGVSAGLAALASGPVSAGRQSGFIGGGQIGYNYQINNTWVAGIEADLQGISGSGSTGSLATAGVVVGSAITSTLTASANTEWLGTLRGRLGFLATPAVLVYGTGGLAFGHNTVTTALAQSGTNGFIGAGAGSFSDTSVGWTAGAGVEWMFAQKWTAKLEYLHYDLGTDSFTWAARGTPASAFFSGVVYQTEVTSVQFRGDIVRVGLNYKF